MFVPTPKVKRKNLTIGGRYFLYNGKFLWNSLLYKRNFRPLMRTRASMKFVVSDRARRENVLWHIFYHEYIDNNFPAE